MLFGGGTLRSAAMQRWLVPQELYEVLTNFQRMGLTLSYQPPINPQNGDIYIFDHVKTPTYKNDGINFTKRKERNSTQEDMRKILIDGVHVITGWNAISADDSNFRRRRYRLTIEGSSIFLVHYRDCYADEMRKMERRRSRTKSVSSSRNNSIAMPTSDTSPYDTYVDSMGWIDDETDSSFRTMLSEFLDDDNTTPYGNPTVTPSPPFLPPVPAIPTSSPMDFQPPTLPAINSYLPAAASLLTPISSAPSHAVGPITILDFSPSWDHTSGGSKILFVLSSGIPDNYQQGIQVFFGSTAAPACMLSSTVLRCESPAVSDPCRCSISIRGRDMVINCRDLFEYRQSAAASSPDVPMQSDLAIDSASSKRRVPESLALLDTHHHKIRLVEKLANSADDATPHSERSHDDDWLDDKALALLSSGDLEKLMDKFLLRVVKQLVQMVTLDDDLKAELDTLDASGYSLLHYCCLFNLPGLVLKLLEHGVDVMQRSNAGETPLHLAIHANHMSVVEVLVAAGSDPYAKDLRNISPLELCLHEGRVAMYDYIASRATTPHAGETPRDVSSAMDTSEATDNSQKVSLLQGALSSLSLTDKCALSLSFSNVHTTENTLESAIAASPRADEVQSVLSETDKESLDVAMSMMGPTELTAVEQEVKLIQNNVRAWLLRKNYTNLREAAKILQGAWREKRNSHRISSQRCINDQKRNSTSTYDRRQVDAAATLQAATRGMLARKEFQRVKRQAMASLVIQKSLLMWWVHNKQAAT